MKKLKFLPALGVLALLGALARWLLAEDKEDNSAEAEAYHSSVC